MTLQVLAQHLASHGRGGDELLVHMTRQEVAGLDALARQHYGHGLPTNPQTGLPEASLLGGFLPAILGIGGAMMGIPPIYTAALVGGGTVLAGGSLMKGLSAGLGAYGGASLAPGVESMMSTGAGSAGAGAAASGIADGTAAEFVGGQGIAADAAGSGAAAMDSTGAAAMGAQLGDYGNYDPSAFAGGPGSMGTGAASLGSAPPGAQPPAQPSAVPKSVAAQSDKTPNTWDKFSNAVGGNKKAMNYGLMALAPAMSEMPKTRTPQSAQSNALLRPYRYDPITQRMSALPPVPAANANGMMFAGGGSVPGFAAGGAFGLNNTIQDALDKATQQARTSSAAPTGIAGGSGLSGPPGSSSFVGTPGTPTNSFAMPPYVPPPPMDFTKTFSNPSGRPGMGTSVMAFNPATGTPAPVGAWTGPQDQPSTMGMTVGQRMAASYASPAASSGPSFNYDPHSQTFTPIAPAPAAAGIPGTSAPQTFDLTQPDQQMSWARSLGPDPSAGFAKGGRPAQQGIAALAPARGRHLQGPGDGVSDSIPATIDGRQPARLATDEYVVPARTVAEIGNGSSSAGAKRLDQMVARVQQRAATTTRGRSAVAKDTKAYKALPA